MAIEKIYSFAQPSSINRAEILKALDESIDIRNSLKDELDKIIRSSEIIVDAFKSGSKVLIAGNGGNASDAIHFTAEFVGKYNKLDRPGLPAICLNLNPSIITAWTNDYGFDTLYERQIEALGKSGDVFIAISTGGGSLEAGLSSNIAFAAKKAKQMGLKVIGLTGKTGGALKELADPCIIVKSNTTARLQEAHITLAHIIIEMVEEKMFGGKGQPEIAMPSSNIKHMDTINLKRRKIGEGQPAYIIAEVGINHNGSFDLAKELIEKSVEAGADAVKFQKRDAQSIMIKSKINQNPVGRLSKSAQDIPEDAPEFGNWSYPDIRLELTDDNYRELKEFSDKLNIDFSASPWDEKSTDFLVSLGVNFIKIPSPEIKNYSYLEYVAKTNLPLIMSTGTANIEELDRAVSIVKKYNSQLCLLQCTSAYPSKFEEIDLNVIKTLRERYGVPVGYSGHEPGTHVPIAAVALGACVIEKHVTLNRKMSGPDHSASIEMDELREMIKHIREVELALGTSEKKHYQSEDVLMSVLGKSIASTVFIPAGTLLTSDMLTTKGPSTGIPASELQSLVGKRVNQDIEADTLIMLEQVS